MRTVPLLVLLVGCGGAARGPHPTPTFGPASVSFLPLLSELPPDAVERDALLGAATARPSPEARKGLTKTERKIEYGAAVGAAILGQLFSSTKSGLLSYCRCAVHEVDGPWAPTQEMKPQTPAPNETEPTPAAELVPWVTLPKN